MCAYEMSINDILCELGEV